MIDDKPISFFSYLMKETHAVQRNKQHSSIVWKDALFKIRMRYPKHFPRGFPRFGWKISALEKYKSRHKMFGLISLLFE